MTGCKKNLSLNSFDNNSNKHHLTPSSRKVMLENISEIKNTPLQPNRKSVNHLKIEKIDRTKLVVNNPLGRLAHQELEKERLKRQQDEIQRL